MIQWTMTDPVRIFVGTDQRQAPAERALERSLRAHTDANVSITWMRAGDPGWGDEWNRGAPPEEYRPKSRNAWGTWFSCHRLAVPSLCNYRGRAIYLDSDMIVLGDIRELWELPTHGRGAVVNRRQLMDVMLIDCAWPGWPEVAPIEAVKKQGAALGLWRRRLAQAKAFSPTLPGVWDCRDCVPKGCKLAHYTRMGTQPWRPHERFMKYAKHPDKAMLDLWAKWGNNEVTTDA